MASFLETCGVRPLEVHVEPEGGAGATVHRFPDQPFFVIGRGPRCHVRLDGAGVSRRHAYFQAVGGRVFCTDLASRTGVRWPSGPRPSGWVDWEEPLRIGGAVIRIARPPSAAAPGSVGEQGPAASSQAARVVFEVTGGPGGVVMWRMNQPLVLAGSAGGCKVRLRDPRVSRFHCGLVRGPLGVVWAVDLVSRVGTQLNGQRVAWARIEDGDELQVGPYKLRLRREPHNSLLVKRSPDALPSGRALLAASPGHAPPAALDHSLLLPVMNAFNQMQQQMLDQFHQTILTMAEMFASLHKEQAGLVREELENLRRVTSELNSLQAERARLPIQERPRLALRHAAGVAETADIEEDRRQAQAVREASGEDQAPVHAPGAAPASATAPEPPKEAAEKPAAAAAPADVHDWLSRRVDQLQAERQGSWQKLMRLVTGR